MTLSRRIPSLDGLRAISIALVLLAHLGGTTGFPFSLERVRVDLGAIGVRVFFVISGFLITSLLRAEFDKSRAISLRSFYWRRSLRILPPALVYLSFALLLRSIHVIDLPTRDILHAATYTMNYLWPRGWYLGHLWSLSIEEQFYLVWPLVMRRGLTTARNAAASCLFLAPLWRVGLALARPDLRVTIGENGVDALAAGCLLCLLRDELWQCKAYRLLISTRVLTWLLPALIWAPFYVASWSYGAYWGAGMSIQNLAIMAAIDATTRRPDTIIGRALNHQHIRQIGLWSYSLYLWQQLFLNRTGTSILQMFPLSVMCALAAAALSYRLVELPALKLRARL